MWDDYLHCRRERFESRYRRPLPWYEKVDPATLEGLMWEVSRRLGIKPTASLATVTGAAYEQVEWMERFGKHSLRAAFEWLGIKTDCTVLLSGDDGRWVVRLLLKDALEFWEVLEPTDFASYLISEEGAWIVVVHHEGMVGGIVLPGARKREGH